MSIIMKNVKSITLGGVSVKRIEDKNGNVLWGNKISATINLTVGSGQDITTTQSSTQLNLPSIDSIKNAIRTKTGIIPSSITKVEVYVGEPLYWKSPSTSEICPWLASNSSGTKPTPPSKGGTSRTLTVPTVFGSGYVDVTTLINDTSTAPFYGWVEYVRVSSNNWFRMNGGNRGKLCDSNGDGLPVYKIRVTYEY